MNSFIDCPSLLFRSSNSSNFSRLSARSSLARCLSRNSRRVLKPVSFFKSSILICAKTFSRIFVSSSFRRVSATAISFFYFASSVISLQANSSCLYSSYDLHLDLNTGGLIVVAILDYSLSHLFFSFWLTLFILPRKQSTL